MTVITSGRRYRPTGSFEIDRSGVRGTFFQININGLDNRYNTLVTRYEVLNGNGGYNFHLPGETHPSH